MKFNNFPIKKRTIIIIPIYRDYNSNRQQITKNKFSSLKEIIKKHRLYALVYS